MTQKDKELLLKDLSGRVPYDLICRGFIANDPMLIDCILRSVGKDYVITTYKTNAGIFLSDEDCIIKPYLRPMSSMTEEEKEELNNYIFSEKGLRYFWFDDGIMYSGPDNQCFIGLGNDTIDKMIEWLNKHHFDYRGLIERGLALEAPEGMYNIKEE